MVIAIAGGGIAGRLLDRAFGNPGDFMGQEELRALLDRYKRNAGYNSTEELGKPGAARAA